MSHKGRCFRDRRKTKRRKLRQVIADFFKPIEVHVPQIAEIPLPAPRTDLPLSQTYAKPEKEVSLKRRSW